MNNLKFGVLACGVLGLVAVFLPWISMGELSMSMWKARVGPEGGQVYVVMAGFVAAAVMGGMAAAKPPMLRWQGIVAGLGFLLVIVKLRDGLPADIFKAPFAIGAKLMALSAIVGLVVSILTVAKPETAK